MFLGDFIVSEGHEHPLVIVIALKQVTFEFFLACGILYVTCVSGIIIHFHSLYSLKVNCIYEMQHYATKMNPFFYCDTYMVLANSFMTHGMLKFNSTFN